MDNISSGLYRYAGNSAYTKFRIVFTDPSEGWVSEASQTANSASNYNQFTRKSTSMKQEIHSTAGGPNLDALHQASYIIAKHPETGNWIVNEEKLSELDDGTIDISSAINANSNNEKERRCLADALRREGFKLCVATSESRSKCHVCQQKLFGNFAPSGHDEIICNRENHLFDESKQNNVEMAVDGEADRLAARSAGNNFRTPPCDDHPQDTNFSGLVVERRRATNWGDSSSTTSVSGSNGYWRYVDSRKLATDSDNIAEGRSIQTTQRRTNTISLMMRNHHFPLYKSCQCSRIKSARIDKMAFNGFCADSFVCTLCCSLIDNGIASDNNENRNNRDRRRDNQVGGEEEIPIKKILCGCCCCSGCGKMRDNCPTERLQPSRARLCNCRELGGGYKTYQRSSSRLPATTKMTVSKQLANVKPHNDNLMSLFWMMSKDKQQKQKSDYFNIQTSKFLNRKLAKLMVTRNEQQQQLDYNLTLDHHYSSCDHEGFDSFQADNIDLIQETNDLCELGNEEDFLFEATRALGNPQAESKSSDETVNLNIKRRLKTLNSTPPPTPADVKLNNSFRGVSHLVCHCCNSKPHGETLLILLHRPKSIALRTDSGVKIVLTDETNGAANQSDTALESIEAADSGAIISAATLSSDGSNQANANKTNRDTKDDERESFTGEGNEAEDQRETQSRLEPPLKDQDLSATDASQPSDSIVLAAIVIDVFNRATQVTPDLNELVMLDLSTLDAPHDEVLDASALMAAAGGLRSRLVRVNRIFYHLETFYHASELQASELDQDLLRRSLGLHRFEIDPIRSTSRNPIDSGLQSLCIDPFSAWEPERVLLKLQLDIDHIRKLSTNCWNLYIRYKVLVKKNESWHIRKLPEERMERQERGYHRNLNDTDQAEDCLSRLQTIRTSQTNHNCGKDKRNLEHVTHFGRGAWRQAMPNPAAATSATSYTNSVASNIFASMATSNKCNSGDNEQHKVIDVTSVMESRRLEDSQHDNDADDANGGGSDDDDEDKYQLLLEGSTITSRPSSNGIFNFCCVEQFLLELSSRRQTTEPPSGTSGVARDQRKFSATRMDQHDAKTPKTNETIAHKRKIGAQIDEQTSSKSNDRNQMQTSNGGVVGSLGNLTTDDRLISPKSSDLERPPTFISSAEVEQISSDNFVVITNENYPIKSAINHETDHSVQSQSDSDQMTGGNDNRDEQQSQVGLINPETSNKPFKSRDLKSVDSAMNNDNNKSMGPRAKSSRGASDGDESFDVNNNNLCINDGPYEGDTCELIFVFEIYSRDFYTDKLKGWSSMKVPISLDKNSLINNNIKAQVNAYQINNLMGGGSLRQSQGCGKSANHHDRCRRELPVMRPALSRPIDFLRYYIFGDIPTNTPDITSFARSDCRYMTHTQHCGDLVVRLDILRQHK